MPFVIEVECPSCGLDTPVEIEVQSGITSIYVPEKTHICVHCGKLLSVNVNIDIQTERVMD